MCKSDTLTHALYVNKTAPKDTHTLTYKQRKFILHMTPWKQPKYFTDGRTNKGDH